MASMEGNYTDNAISHALKKLEIPFYVVESRNMPDAVSIANAYAKHNPGIENRLLFPTRSFLPQLEAPDRLLEVIQMFLQK